MKNSHSLERAYKLYYTILDRELIWILMWLFIPDRPPTFFQCILVMNILSNRAALSLTKQYKPLLLVAYQPNQCGCQMNYAFTQNSQKSHNDFVFGLFPLSAYLCSCIKRCVPSPQLKRYLQRDKRTCTGVRTHDVSSVRLSRPATITLLSTV